MDKIQEMHLKTSGNGFFAKDHAAITEDMMRKAMEWARKEGYRITDEGLYWYKKGVKIEAGVQVWFSDSELINLFKQQL